MSNKDGGCYLPPFLEALDYDYASEEALAQWRRDKNRQAEQLRYYGYRKAIAEKRSIEREADAIVRKGSKTHAEWVHNEGRLRYLKDRYREADEKARNSVE
jgi:hypothetical protein